MGQQNMQDYFNYIKEVTAIHNETVRRLVDRDDTPPLELADLFEDVANRYLDISDEIRAWVISNEIRSKFPAIRQLTEPLSRIENLWEEPLD